MKLPGNRALFGIAVLTGALFIIGSALNSRYSAAASGEQQAMPVTHHLHGQIHVTEQISPQSIAALKLQGIQTIIDMRPDGEVPGQPPAALMEKEAQSAGLKFSYIPVQHGEISDASVTALKNVLVKSEGPVLMYCRSGSRAARTWSLVEASRPEGLDAEAILAAVKTAGLKAEDLETDIRKRIAARGGKDVKS